MGQVQLPAIPSLNYRRQYFSSSGTFTLPLSGINNFDCILVSGGASGNRTVTNYPPANKNYGGSSCVAYFTSVFCTNGAELTITVGAGGAAVIAPTSGGGSNGTPSTITGILGNGVSSTLTSGVARAGFEATANAAVATPAYLSDAMFFRVTPQNQGQYTQGPKSAVGTGFGAFGVSVGSGRYGASQNLFAQNIGNNSTVLSNTLTHTGGPIPLLGNYLHAAVGQAGGNSAFNGGAVTANTFFAGGGGGNYNSTNIGGGQGGAGGSGGISNTATFSGNGGNASANSGGGGGANGKNTNTPANSGNSGAGGSGFVIIGYWS